MYSFQPVIDHSNEHGFFYMMLVVGALWLWMIYSESESKPVKIGNTIAIALILAFGHWISYMPAHPLNKQVTATFVGYQAEGFTQQSGKTRSEHHVMYVVYRVPEGTVALPGSAGVSYPESAILYKN